MSLLAVAFTEARVSARSLAHAPGFTLTVVITLALGLGAAIALFGVIDCVLLRPLPYARPERRVMVWSRWVDFPKTWVGEAELLDYRERIPSFRQVAAWDLGQASLAGDGEPLRVGMAAVTANAFSALGAVPELGRAFSEEEGQAGANLAVVSHGLWQRRYGGDPALVGRAIRVDGVPRLVVGVMPPGFRLPTDFGEAAAEPTELWIPLTVKAAQPNRGDHGWYAAAELRAGATVEQANAELSGLALAWEKDGLYPEAMRFRPFVITVQDEITAAVRPALLLLAGACAFLLLIACANVASLMLVRAEARRRETAIRAALGAGGVRLLARLLAEALLLSIPALALGLALAAGSLRLLLASGLVVVPRAEAVRIDPRVAAFAALVSVAATLSASLLPALGLARANLGEAMRGAGNASTAAPSRVRLRKGLVVAELGLSVVLLLGAGLLVQSLLALSRVDLGFRPQGVLTMRVSLPELGYEKPGQVASFYSRLLRGVRALPGVAHAGVVRSLPLGGQIGDFGLTIEGYVAPPGQHAKGDWQVASDGALEALGERLLRGRALAEADQADGQLVALVNETMARRYWPDQDPLGRRFRLGGGDERPWLSVVGVVGDVRHNGLSAPIKEKFYVPHAQFQRAAGWAPRSMTLIVEAAGDPLTLKAPVLEVVRRLDPELPVAAVRPLTEIVADALGPARLSGLLLAIFAAVALVLSAVGLFGVLAQLVGQRTREIGIRMALGAEPARVRALVLRQGLGLALLGVGLGLLGALASARLLEGLLVGIAPRDPATYAAAALFLVAVAFVASDLPARRATRVDPLSALRTD